MKEYKKIINGIWAAIMGFVLIACTETVIEDKPISPVDPVEPVEVENNITLRVNVPKGSTQPYTYANEDGTLAENHIDTLFIKIKVSNTEVFDTLIYGAGLTTVGGTNDSIVTVDFKVDNSLLTGGPITAEILANERNPRTITDEIPPAAAPNKWFTMAGEGALTLSGSGTKYECEVHLVRHVAKLRTKVSKSASAIPAALEIDYSNIKIAVLNVPNKVQTFSPPPVSTPAGLAYINYTERGVNAGATSGGKVDSLYLYENYLDPESGYNASNITTVRVTIPTRKSATDVWRNDTYEYQLQTGVAPSNSYRIHRNFIYTLDIQVRGQGLEPLMSLNILPWDDVEMDGSVLGTYLDMESSDIYLDDEGGALHFSTDAQAVYIDWSGVGGALNADTTQILLDKGHNGVLHFDWTGAPSALTGVPVIITAGNITKTVYLYSLTLKTGAALNALYGTTVTKFTYGLMSDYKYQLSGWVRAGSADLSESNKTGVYMDGTEAYLLVGSYKVKTNPDLTGMFSLCTSLDEVDLSHFDTKNVTNMQSMFGGCANLVSLDLSSFDTQNVTDMSSMFAGNTLLHTIKSNTFNAASVTTSLNMFTNCSSLVGGNGTTYSAANTDATYAKVDNEGGTPGYFTAP